MCPGGTVVAATSEPERMVTNGMSQYSRNERNANSGFVVDITPDDYPGHPLAGVETRTSSPVRIKRLDNFQSVNTKGLFPASEGAGYAGAFFRRAWTASRSPRRSH